MGQDLKKIAIEQKKIYKNLTKQQQIWLKKIVEDAHRAEHAPIPNKWTWALVVGHHSLAPKFLYSTPRIRVPADANKKINKRIIRRFLNQRKKHGLGEYQIYPGSDPGDIAIYGQGEIFTEAINPL